MTKKIKQNQSEPLRYARQEAYCRFFILGNQDTYGSQVASYIAAYKPEEWFNENLNREQLEKKRLELRTDNSSRVMAANLMKKPEILKRIEYLMINEGFNNETIDAHLMYVVRQFGDLGNKVRAIAEYNKIQGRITEKLDILGHNAENNPLDEKIKKLKEKKIK